MITNWKKVCTWIGKMKTNKNKSKQICKQKLIKMRTTMTKASTEIQTKNKVYLQKQIM